MKAIGSFHLLGRSLFYEVEKLVWQFQVSILILLGAIEFGDERLEMAHRLAPGMLEVVEAPYFTLADEFSLKPVF